GVYQLYRHLYRAAGANEAYFSLGADACAMDVAQAEMKLSELRYVRALREKTEEKAEFPELNSQALTAAFPGRCQSLTQVLSTADARLSGLTE
ncbi:MAG: transcriptional regulator, partial [Oscillibacter sp.]